MRAGVFGSLSIEGAQSAYAYTDEGRGGMNFLGRRRGGACLKRRLGHGRCRARAHTTRRVQAGAMYVSHTLHATAPPRCASSVAAARRGVVRDERARAGSVLCFTASCRLGPTCQSSPPRNACIPPPSPWPRQPSGRWPAGRQRRRETAREHESHKRRSQPAAPSAHTCASAHVHARDVRCALRCDRC